MVIIQFAFFTISIFLTLLFFIYGFNLYFLLIAAKKYKAPELPEAQDFRPAISVQLPIYNEKYVLPRLITACARMTETYGKDLVHLLILDDSDDDTQFEIDRIIQQFQQKGFRFDVLRRTNREGFKAGALHAALEITNEDFIAIFDADFIPPADFLTRTLPYFASNEWLGIVQSRWTHSNQDENVLTRAVSHIMDIHFLIEQPGRFSQGLFQNFNGSGGVLRRKAILEAGGWQSDTLAEDLDLSYRMEMCGYSMLYLRDLCCPGEIPPSVPSFKLQQGRWANGTFGTAWKILPRLSRDRKQGFKRRLEGMIHLTGYLIQPLMVFSFLLGSFAAITGVNRYQSYLASSIQPSVANLLKFTPASLILWQNLIWVILAPFIAACTLAPWISLLTTIRIQKLPLLQNIPSLMVLLVLCFGISLSILRGAERSLFSQKKREWVRTPKTAATERSRSGKDSGYRMPVDSLWIWELIFVSLGLMAIWTSIRDGTLSGLFILLPFTFSYGFVLLLSIIQNVRSRT